MFVLLARTVAHLLAMEHAVVLIRFAHMVSATAIMNILILLVNTDSFLKSWKSIIFQMMIKGF
jgi:hypothetical protein